MELADIKSLIDIAQRLGLAELEVCKNGVTLRLARDAQSAAVGERPHEFVAADAGQEAAPAVAQGDLIAPLSGVLHLSPSPDAPPFVAAGQEVKQGDTLCIIEAMKVFNRVVTERDGIVEAVLFETGVDIEAGQILMRIA